MLTSSLIKICPKAVDSIGMHARSNKFARQNKNLILVLVGAENFGVVSTWYVSLQFLVLQVPFLLRGLVF